MPPNKFKLLLDEGFPKPIPLMLSALDKSIKIAHLADFAPNLMNKGTPDWYLYCVAAEGGIDALVTRDLAQLDETEAAYVLSKLKKLTIVSWRKGIDDPAQIWGQLLAFLPLIKRRCKEKGGRAILLPVPSLRKESFRVASHTLGIQARKRGISTQQIRHEAQRTISDWLIRSDESVDRFDDLLNH